MKPRAYSEKSTHACTARHTLVLRLLIMIPYTTMSVCYLLVDISRIYPSLFCLEISMLDLNLVSLSTEVTSKELLLDKHVRRLQEVVDKEPYHDDQATCAIIVGTSGHKTYKVGQANRWTKSWEISCFLYLAT